MMDEIPSARTSKVIAIFLLNIIPSFAIIVTDNKTKYDHPDQQDENTT